MKTILVTGATGFIGKNLTENIRKLGIYTILEANSATTEDNLSLFIEKADFIAHFGGVTRSEVSSDFQNGNESYTQKIVTLLSQKKKVTPIFFASSVYSGAPNEYGRTKKMCEDILRDYSSANKAPVYIVRLTNTFGKYARPNYHSVVATFCYNISHNKPISIIEPERIIKLLYIDSLIETVVSCIEGRMRPYFILNNETLTYSIEETTEISVRNLAQLIQDIEGRAGDTSLSSFEENILTTFRYYKSTP